jgi:hypothetical protein
MESRYDQIINFCRKVSSDAHADPNVVKVSISSLAGLGYDIRTFSYEELRAACVGLTYTLLYKGMNMIIGEDHRLLWDTIGKYLLEPPSLYFGETDNNPFPIDYNQFRQLFVAVIKIATGEWELCQLRPISIWIWPQMPQGLPVDANIVSYLVYPLLEAVLKETLSSYISRNGEVIQYFQVSDGREYSPTGRSKWCSKVNHMLDLLDQQTSLVDLRIDLKLIYDHIVFLYGRDARFVIANDWRNPAIHGENNIPTAYGVLLNIILLIAMDHVKDGLIKKLH